jgi:hypothetical protein
LYPKHVSFLCPCVCACGLPCREARAPVCGSQYSRLYASGSAARCGSRVEEAQLEASSSRPGAHTAALYRACCGATAVRSSRVQHTAVLYLQHALCVAAVLAVLAVELLQRCSRVSQRCVSCVTLAVILQRSSRVCKRCVAHSKRCAALAVALVTLYTLSQLLSGASALLYYS